MCVRDVPREHGRMVHLNLVELVLLLGLHNVIPQMVKQHGVMQDMDLTKTPEPVQSVAQEHIQSVAQCHVQIVYQLVLQHVIIKQV